MSTEQTNPSHSPQPGAFWKLLSFLAFAAALGGTSILSSKWQSQVADISRQLVERSDETKKLRLEAEKDAGQLRQQIQSLQISLQADRQAWQSLSTMAANRLANLEAQVQAVAQAAPFDRAAIGALKQQLEHLSAQEEQLAKILAPQQTRELKNPSALVRQEAAESLKLLGPRAKAAVVALERAAKDADAGVRNRAAAALEAIGPVPPLDHLLMRLRDPDEPAEARRSTARELAKRFWPEPVVLQALKEVSLDAQVQADVEQAIQAIGKRTTLLEGHPGWVTSLALSSDGKLLAAGCSPNDDKPDSSKADEVHLWDMGTHKRLRILKARVDALDFSHDGKVLAIGSAREAQLWDPHEGKKLQSIEAGGPLYRLVISPDGRFLAWAEADTRLIVWDLGKGEKYATAELAKVPLSDPTERPAWVNSQAFSPDSKTLALSGPTEGGSGGDGPRNDGYTLLWDVAKKEFRVKMSHGNWNGRVAFLDAGKTLVSGGYYNRKQVMGTLVSPDGSLSAGLDGKYNREGEWVPHGIILHELATGKPLLTLPAPHVPLGSLAFTPNGKSLASGGNGTVYLWRLDDLLEDARR